MRLSLFLFIVFFFGLQFKVFRGSARKKWSERCDCWETNEWNASAGITARLFLDATPRAPKRASVRFWVEESATPAHYSLSAFRFESSLRMSDFLYYYFFLSFSEICDYDLLLFLCQTNQLSEERHGAPSLTAEEHRKKMSGTNTYT